MRCICGHTSTFHEGDRQYDQDELGKCDECDCLKFQRDPNWEAPDNDPREGDICYNN